MELDSRHMGWVTSELPFGDTHIIKVELKGPENTLRVRQVRVLGCKEGDSVTIAGQISASVAQQRNCEAETLRVFRLITSQVGGALLPQAASHWPRTGCPIWSWVPTLNESECDRRASGLTGVREADLWRC